MATEARVYLGNLPADADTLEIYSMCAAFGSVLALEVLEAYAFVDFATPESRDRLISTYNGKEFHGKQLKVEAAKAVPAKNSKTVHVIRLPEGTTEASLTERVSAFGNVIKVQISEPHHFAGLHGTVEFENNDAAQKCVSQFSDGGEIQAFVHRSREPRRARNSTSPSRPRRPRNTSESSRSRPRPAAAAAAAPATGASAADSGDASAAPTSPHSEPFTLSLLVPLGQAGAIIGKGGEVIRRILRDTHALVSLATIPHPIPRSVTERLAQIKGTPEEVVAGFREIAAILLEQSADAQVVPLRILVPSDLVGHIIGKAGAQIKALKAQVECNIEIAVCTQPEYASAFWLVSADGSVDDTTKIVQSIIARVAGVVQRGSVLAVDPMKIGQEESVTLILPSSAMGAIIGKQGSVLREISAQSQANIDIEKVAESADPAADRRIWITGPIAAVEHAQHIISSCLQAKDVEIRYVLTIPSSIIGHVIGKRGARIRSIMDETRTNIDIEESGDKASVTIEGSVMNSVNAQRLVRKISDERQA